MPVRPIVDIPIDTRRLDELMKKFKKYDEALAKTAPKWKASERSAKALEQATAELTGEMSKQQKLLDKMEKQRELAERASKRRLDEISGVTGKIAKNLISGTANLLKWGGILTGLAGIFGGFGIDRLAANLANQRRSALGLGVTPGQLSAFNMNFGRYLSNPGGTLSNIAAAQADPAQRWIFGAMGINPDGRSAYEVALQAAQRAKQIVGTGPLNEPYLQSRGLTQIFSMEELRALQHISAQELAATISQTRGTAGSLGLTDAQSRTWQNFNVKLEESGQKLKILVADVLTPLIPDLTNLAGAFVNDLKEFQPEIRKFIKDLEPALRSFVGYIASPEFQQGVKTFAENIALIAQKIVDGLRWLHIIPDDAGGDGPSGSGAWPKNARGPNGDRTVDPAQIMNFYRGLGLTNKGVQAGIVGNLMQESSLDPFNKDPTSSARGLGMWLWGTDKNPGRARLYARIFGHKIEDVKDFDQAVREQEEFQAWEMGLMNIRGANNDWRNPHLVKLGKRLRLMSAAPLGYELDPTIAANMAAGDFYNTDEAPGPHDHTLNKRKAYAQHLVKVQMTVKNQTGGNASVAAGAAAAQ